MTPDHFTFDQCDAKILHLGLPGLHERLDNPWNDDPNGWVTVLKKARAAGIKTNLELCSLPAEQLQKLVLPCLPQLNYLIVNDFEIAALAKDPIEHDQHMDPQTCISNAQKIMTGCDLELVIVHFPMAAVAVTRNGEQFQHPSINLPSNQVVGTNGAGDAFAAGALYAIHEGWPVVEALRLGHASAAASVRHIGTTDAVESWQDCMELAAEFGWRAAL